MTNQIKALLAKYNLTVESVFIPWSRSRNKDEKMPSLNWSVTLLMNGRKILTTDYMAGMGHCPYYKKHSVMGRMSYDDMECIKHECETGRKVSHYGGALSRPMESSTQNLRGTIQPDSADVIYSLLIDSDVLDYPTFESWAGEFGYDPDSRQAEKTYNDCMKIALQFRQIGESVISELREAYQDY